MYYPQEAIEEVRQANDILGLVSSYVTLKKKGGNYFGLCPFHTEKSPSFSVRPEKQMYHCFGCGKSGNSISFVMEYENYSFPEAVEFLAKRAGITLPEREESEEMKRAKSRRESLFAVNREAGVYYFYALRDPSGEKALSYLKGRGLSKETIRAFGLGYAKTAYDALYRYLKGKGFDDAILSDSGIFNKNEKHGMTDKFWNRVIFPIMDVQNRVIGFGGRVMGEGEPKYLNSPETEIFDKGRNLYGLNIARTARTRQLILCEGYMDVISLHQAGFKQAVAALGTSFTNAQARLLKRYADEVLLSLDSDQAGITASIRAIGILREAGLPCRVINLKPYKDPDEFIKNLGTEEFQKRLDEAENSFYFEVRTEEARFDLKDPGGKTEFFKEAAKKLLRFEDALERDNYLEGLSEKYGIRAESLRELVKKQAIVGESIVLPERPGSDKAKGAADEKAEKAARSLLAWIADEPEIYFKIRNYLKPDDFGDGLCKNIAERLFAMLEGGIASPVSILDEYEDGKERELVASILNGGDFDTLSKADKDRTLKELIISVLQAGVNEVRKLDPKEVDIIQLAIDKRRRLENIRAELDKKGSLAG